MHFYFAKILISAFLIVHIFLSKYFESILGTWSNLCSTPKVFIHAWDPFRRLLLFWVCRQERHSKVPFIYYLSTIWGFFDPFPLYVSIFYVLKISNKDNFLNPPGPTPSSAYVIYEWSQRRIASTHFEPTYARRAFPCFDEPHLKAQYIYIRTVSSYFHFSFRTFDSFMAVQARTS